MIYALSRARAWIANGTNRKCSRERLLTLFYSMRSAHANQARLRPIFNAFVTFIAGAFSLVKFLFSFLYISKYPYKNEHVSERKLIYTHYPFNSMKTKTKEKRERKMVEQNQFYLQHMAMLICLSMIRVYLP